MDNTSYLKQLKISKEDKQKVIKMKKQSLKDISNEEFNNQLENIKNELLIPVFNYKGYIWQRVNTKNLDTLDIKDEYIFYIFDRNNKHIFTGIGNIIKQKTKTKKLQVKIEPLIGKHEYSRDFTFIYNYEKCKNKCQLDLQIHKIKDVSPVNKIIESSEEINIKNLITNLENKKKLNKNQIIDDLKNELKKYQEIRIEKQKKEDQKNTNFYPIVFIDKKKNILVAMFTKFKN